MRKFQIIIKIRNSNEHSILWKYRFYNTCWVLSQWISRILLLKVARKNYTFTNPKDLDNKWCIGHWTFYTIIFTYFSFLPNCIPLESLHMNAIVWSIDRFTVSINFVIHEKSQFSLFNLWIELWILYLNKMSVYLYLQIVYWNISMQNNVPLEAYAIQHRE